MKLLKESREDTRVIFDQNDLDFINSMVSPYATAQLNEANERWDEIAGETISLVYSENKYVNVGVLNVTSNYCNAVERYIVKKYGDVTVHFNNTGTIFWASKNIK